MGIKSNLLAVTVLVLSTNAYSALIDNGAYTTDNVSGLDWLDLTSTAGISYNDASLGFDTYEGGGWRYATNEEVENLFGITFDGFYATETSGRSDSSNGAYADQTSDIWSFIGLFGQTPVGAIGFTRSQGMYRDEDNSLTYMGAVIDDNTGNSYLYGIEICPTYCGYNENTGYGTLGTYLVRSSVVPIPAAIWLFGSGLLGLIGVARRKKA